VIEEEKEKEKDNRKSESRQCLNREFKAWVKISDSDKRTSLLQFFFSVAPDPPENCSVINKSSETFHLQCIPGEIFIFKKLFFYYFLPFLVAAAAAGLEPRNTKGRSITVPLTSCLTGLD
jgi:hypothetical protein